MPLENKLANSVCYLSGSMEFCPNGGEQWRQKFKRIINDEMGLDVTFLDPTFKPKGLTPEVHGYYNELKSKGDWKAFTSYMKRIRRDDLRCVDLSDFLVVRIDKTIHACGTYDEVFTAEDQQKPILAIAPGGKWNMPGWMSTVLRENEIFETEEQCADYINKIAKGRLEIDNRWVLMRDYLLEGE